MKKIFFAFLLLLGINLHAAKEEVIASFQSGTSIGSNQPLTIGANLTVQDNWYTFMNLNTSTYQNFFKIKENHTILRLRYDDSKKYDHGTAWQLKVIYNIELFDITDAVNPALTIANETLTINYLDHASPANYTDIDLKRYPNYSKAKVTIQNIIFTPGGPSIPNPIEDIYLDVIESTERYYVLSPLSAATVTTQAGFVNSIATGNSKIQLPVSWSFVYGAESYDLEWLLIDVGTNSPAPHTGNFPFDFRNATRVNVLDNHFEISLAEPAGILLYRVRPIGYDYTGGQLIKVEGAWSFMSTGSTLVNAPSVNQAYRYDFNGLDYTKNWIYTASFAEEGKRKEVIEYYDGALKERQILSTNDPNDKVIITEPLYDYEYRVAGNFIPTPAFSQGIKYYNSGLFQGFNPNYNPFDFDQDINISNPPPIPNVAGASQYFSPANTVGGLNSDYIPNAHGYPFTRTTFLNDGTGRVRTQSHTGINLTSGSGHEVNYIYGKPNHQVELDRLFGNEVGFRNNYFKRGVIDENSQVKVEYLDNSGRVIASCLAGSPPSNLYELDFKPPVSPIKVDILENNNAINSQDQLVSSQLLTVFIPTLHKFEYDLAQTLFCKTCPGYTLCEDCKYDLEIVFKDQNGFLLSTLNITSSSPPVAPGSNPIVFTNVTSGQVSFEVNLLPGTYIVDKILKINQASLNTLTSTYINDQLLNPTCITYPKITPEPCGNGCKTACEERYKRYDFSNNTYYYVDDNEVTITSTQAATLIANCEQICESPEYPEEAGYCAIKLQSLKRDMSPGGQYFSNTIVQFTNTPAGIVEDPAYPLHKYDWLNINLSSSSSSIFAALTFSSGVTISSWADVEANWQDYFTNELVKYHPEYCAYKYFCEGEIVCSKGAGGYTISVAASNNYDEDLNDANQATALTNGYFNTINYTNSPSHNTGNFLTGNTSYCPNTYSAAIAPNLDPFVDFSCQIQLRKCASSSGQFLTNYLKNYLDIGGGNHFSIWYVLDDPDNIHLIAAASATTPSQPVIDFFKQLHGDGTSSNPGLFANLSKWEYFRSVYLFYKQLFIYDNYSNYACSPPSIKNPLAPAATSVSLTHDQFTMHFQRNFIFESMVNSIGGSCDFLANASLYTSTFTTGIANTTASMCNDNCTASADSWIAQLSTCTLTPSQITNIKFYLIEVCKKECNTENIVGTSGCSSTVTGCSFVAGPGSAQFYNFNDVVNYFAPGSCTVSIKHPITYNDANCSCSNLTNYIIENGLTSSSDAAIASAINTSFGNTTSYTGSDIANWKGICNSAVVSYTTLTGSAFPTSFICTTQASTYNATDCSCEKINQFINQVGYDQLVPADYPYIVSAINNYFALPSASLISVPQFTTVISSCTNNAVPSYTFFQANNVPEVLLCPVATGTTEAELETAQGLANCQKIQLSIATSHAVYLFNLYIAATSAGFKDEYTDFCLGEALAGKESFIMDYLLDEFKYTLYYYDQAGNLVKTVAPEGLEMVTNPADLLAIANHRNNTTSFPPFYPKHRMVTRSKYDTYDKKIENDSPDGGLTLFFYDNKSRVVNSQSARQRNELPVPAYSYVNYDALNRAVESGDLKNSIFLTQKIARNKDAITYTSWVLNAGTSMNQITKMYYDVIGLTLSPNPFFPGQSNLRGRLVHTTYQEVFGSSYDHGMHYSYDVHGNVERQVQENNYLDVGSSRIVPLPERFKLHEFEYGLIDGSFTKVSFQRGQVDMYSQKFEYDKSNGLDRVYSSLNNTIWESDAKYFYYPHMPLLRAEYGDKQVQGIDFAYTLQGWLKGINSSFPSSSQDIGKDALSSNTNLNNYFSHDAYSFTNGYYINDYSAINPALNVPAGNFVADPFATSNTFGDYIYNTGSSPRNYQLFNGAIAFETRGSMKPDGSLMDVFGNTYVYDQLYRLREHHRFQDPQLTLNNFWNTFAVHANIKEEFHYDYNGNIASVVRDAINSSSSPAPMDILTYQYASNTTTLKRENNKLYGIDDFVSAGSFDDDIDDQYAAFTTLPPDNDPALNYSYNEDGQLRRDKSEGIQLIEYTVNGTVKRITRDPNFFEMVGSLVVFPSDIEFLYDALGRRCVKIVKPREAVTGFPTVSQLRPPQYWTYTIYTYDMQDNVAAVYTKQLFGSTVEYHLTEQHVYGNSRIAQIERDVFLPPSVIPSPDFAKRTLGNKTYELSGNAGNIYSTISDYRLSAGTTLNQVSYYRPVVESAKDYFSFGTPMPNRNFIVDDYRFGHNGGSEKDKEVTGHENAYGTFYRELDTRMARWWSMDPLFDAAESPYASNNNNPISLSDAMGDKPGGWFNRNFGIKSDVRFEIHKDSYGWSYAGAYGISMFDKDRKSNFSKKAGMNLSLNIGVRYYEGGLGSTGLGGDRQVDLIVTPALAVGFKQFKIDGKPGMAIEQNIFNSYSTFAVDNELKLSLAGGMNFIINSEGRHQFTGGFMGRIWFVTAMTYNDLFGDTDDRWWTGGGNIGIHFGLSKNKWVAFPGSVYLGTEVFTGERITKIDDHSIPSRDRYFVFPFEGFLYYTQSLRDAELTNGIGRLYLRSNGFGGRVYYTGGMGKGFSNPMWMQNKIHDAWEIPLPRFLSIAPLFFHMSKIDRSK